MKKKDATIACLVFLGGAVLVAFVWMWSIANGRPAIARDAVRSLLLQPEQARFESVILYPATSIVCGRFFMRQSAGSVGPMLHFISMDGEILLERQAAHVLKAHAKLDDLPRLAQLCPEFKLLAAPRL